MTLLDGPAAFTGGGAFEYADLSVAGVELAPEQIGLLTDSLRKPVCALGAGSATDPRSLNGAPLVVMDDEGFPSLQMVPMAFSLAPEDWRAYSPDDKDLRFPSVVACELGFDETGGDGWRDDPQMVRLWTLWPVQPYDVDVILEALADWSRDIYRPLELYLAADEGIISPCRAVTEALEHPVGSHSHDDHPVHMHCWDAEDWMREYHDAHFGVTHDGEYALLELPGPQLPDTLQQTFDRLVATSHADSYRAVGAIPSWKRQEIINSERKYSPWLWLS